MDKMPIRNMREEDIDPALALINKEGWGYTRVEIERMLLMDPDGSYVFEDRQLLGVITSVTYGRTGVIGHLVVSEHARGKKIGQALIKRAVEYCESARAESILLYATPEGKPVYGKFGFVAKRPAMVTRAPFSKADYMLENNPCSKMIPRDLESARSMDTLSFGDDRGKLLRLLYTQFPEHSWKIERNGLLVGFVMGRVTPAGFDIGPWECISGPKDAEILLRTVLKSFGEGIVYLGVLADNSEAVRMANTLSSITRWNTEFMVRGKERYPSPQGMYGISSFELG